MARRDAAAERRREGPLAAVMHRLELLEREVPRLEVEVASLEKQRASPPGLRQSFASGLLRGALLTFAALVWVVGVVTLDPTAHVDAPVRVLAMLGAVVSITVSRVVQETRS
ncbi:MAG: hypothetical protein JNM69_18655 [Archangium sp.]|nr:hypothetical protein [Archangium sp.]